MGTQKEKGKKPTFSFVTKIKNYFPTKEQFFYLPRVLSRNERLLIIGLIMLMVASFCAIPLSAYYHLTTPVADYGGAWSEGMIGVPQHINPLLLQTNDVDSDLVHLLYAGLLRYTDNGKLVPELADSYQVSDDGLEYTFILKKGLTWHDGQSITSDDVVFTILTAQNSDYGSTQRINWQGVDVTKKDDLTISFRLKNRYAQFINNATLGILPKHIWENTKAVQFSLTENNLKPIGAGPYKLTGTPKRDASGAIRSLELTSFDHYALGKPYIDTIELHFYDSEQFAVSAYNTGEVEGLSFVSAQNIKSLNSKGSLTIHNLRLPRYFGLFFNQTKSMPLSDAKVRVALNYATQKEALVKDVLDGNGTIVDSPLLPGIISISENPMSYKFDLEKAGALLDEAGWKFSSENGVRTKEITIEKKKELVKLEVEITTSSWPELVSVANILKSQWEKVGVRVTVKILSVPEIQQAIKERNYTTLLFGEVLGLDPDPFSFWHSSQKKDSGLNLALYDNDKANKILEDARQTLDPVKRMQMYEQLQNIIIADAPAVFLYSPDYLYVQPDKIKNNIMDIIAIPSNRFDTVYQWYIDTKRTKE